MIARNPGAGRAPSGPRKEKSSVRERVARLAIAVLLGLFPSGPPHVDGDPVALAQGTEAPGNAVAAGELLVEPPTLINLGFEWSIEGDDNRNAAVEVAYRRQGETAWLPALPLLRLQGERIFVGNQFDVVVPNLFAGSILDLEPDTAYEARFVMDRSRRRDRTRRAEP